ncbi:DsrE family protein [Rhodalgimonas zhirmunskyi]|uniref:DsrE family protein n=1 Tax=Rhodalgimonas zhirmunskyi TaxID=2964767 RepID=A0AAJ1U941_9RHOB|nr:DsrE family protein [Rhodoalgimonas zhirmunskyi]MDQ2095234.1 DsrE family protein [Rhodoalgimonas zhirmunskyi]
MKRFIAGIALILSLVAAPMMAMAESHAKTAEADKAPLFINLTTDDTWSAAKAIMFAHEKSLKNGHPTAIWLNVRAVYLADKKRPSHVHGLMKESGKSIQDMLADFMAAGGEVIMCQACSGAAGLTQADYIDGVTMGSWPVVEGWLFRDGVSTLSW